jgi:Uncharacterized ACR, COG1993
MLYDEALPALAADSVFVSRRRTGSPLAILRFYAESASDPSGVKKPLMLYFWIMLGSALGGAARYWFSEVVSNAESARDASCRHDRIARADELWPFEPPPLREDRLSEDLPVVIEIVDSEDKINVFLPVLDSMVGSGLVALEKVQVLQYGSTSIKQSD